MALTFYDPAYVAIDQWVPPERRVRAVATLTLLAGLSGPVSIPLAGALVEALGWRRATVVLGAGLAVLGAAVARFALPGAPPRPRPGASAESAAAGVGPRRLLADRRFVVFTAACVLAYGATEAVVVHRVARFEEAGVALATATAWAAASGLLTIPGRFALPSLASRLPGTAVLAGVLATLAAATAVAVGGEGRTWQVAGHFGLFGLVFGAAHPLRAVVMGGWYSGANYGRVMGTQAAAVAVGRAGGPTAVGLVRDATSGYGAAMALLAAALAGATLLTVASGGAARKAPAAAAPGPPGG